MRSLVLLQRLVHKPQAFTSALRWEEQQTRLLEPWGGVHGTLSHTGTHGTGTAQPDVTRGRSHALFLHII